MGNKILNVRSFNLLLLFFISVLLILLIVTAMLFLYSSVNSDLPFPSIMAAAFLLLFCLPISVLLYFNDKELVTKKIFRALALTFLLLSISGISWYLIAEAFNLQFFVYIGMLTMIVSYIPMILTLFNLYNYQKHKLDKIIRSFVTYVIICFFTLFIIFDIINIAKGSNPFSVLVFSTSVVCDLLIVGLSIMLILINMPTQLRYLLSIIFGFDSINFIGDIFNLFTYTGFYDSPINPQYFYDAMLLFASGTLLIYALSNIKITTIEEVNKKLRDTTLVVEDLIMQSPDHMSMCDVDGKIIKANDSFLKVFNVHDNIFNIKINSDVRLSFDDVKLGKTVHFESVKVMTNSNTEKYFSVTLYPTYTSDKIISNYIFIAEDITVRINAENALKLANDELENRVIQRTIELSNLNDTLQKEIYEHKIDEERIKASLKEKEVLLKEIHHRVKNNMQIISSMLGLQSTYVKEYYFNEILKDCQNRIKSMALIHEKLYQSDNMAKINISDYISSLISNLRKSYVSENITLNYNIENETSFNLDVAIPLGLIINELITNSLKHGFPNCRSGNICLDINKINGNEYSLIIKDDGIGLPADFNIEDTRTLGLQLVKVLVEQINGRIEIKNDNGAVFIIEFSSI